MPDMSDALKEQILASQNECTLIWNTQDGNSTGTMITFVWYKQRIWMSTHEDMARIRAIRRNPNTTVVVTSSGTEFGKDRSITFRGQCRIHKGSAVNDEFIPAFVGKLSPRTEKSAKELSDLLGDAGNCVLEFIPEKEIRYDGHDYLMALRYD